MGKKDIKSDRATVQKEEVVPKIPIESIMLISVLDDNKPITACIPLSNFDTRQDEDNNVFIIDIHEVTPEMKASIKGKYKSAILRLTTDPKVDWAGGWANMGTFNYKLEVYDVEISYKDNACKISGKNKDLFTRLDVPDRRVE